MLIHAFQGVFLNPYLLSGKMEQGWFVVKPLSFII